MKPSAYAVKAISIEYIRRSLRSVALAGIIIATILIIVAILLVRQSEWWLVMFTPILFIVFICTILLIAAWYVLHTFSVDVTATQKKLVSDFVDKLTRVSEVAKTPTFILLFRVIRDVVRPSRRTSFVISMTQDSSTLHKDFITLQKNFS